MVDRFDPLMLSNCVAMCQINDGSYVLHSEYAALEARVAELEKDAARWWYVADQHSVAWADEIDEAMSREA